MSKKIWELNIKRTMDKKPNLKLDPEEIKDWALENFELCQSTKRQP